MSDEWGPWIEHDGKGCPCVGEYVHNVHNHGGEWFGIAGSQGGRSWDWSANFSKIIRYRIRRHRGMAILNAILTNLPAPVKQYEVMK